MRFRIIPGAIAIIAILLLIETGCTKLDTTLLGTELIPAVDNINTFADTFNVVTSQGYFADSSLVSRDDYNALGNISNDPLFGKTNANIFLQLKPTNYPFLLSRGDTLQGLDSVVLALSYKGTYGDTSIPQHIEVNEIQDNAFRDSIFKLWPVSYTPNFTTLLGSADVNIPSLKNKVYFAHGKDSAVYQIRIKLTDATFNNLLYTADTGVSALNNSFRNDSLFRFGFNGLALRANGSGNALMYVDLKDANTRLEVHFRKSRNGIKDTVYTSLKVAPSSGSIIPSVTANNIVRDRTGSASASVTPGFNYIQTSPGTFINLSVPGLIPFRDTARIIHRAVLLVNQVPDGSNFDSLFTPPSFLYVDLKDSTSTLQYKPVYTDLNPSVFYNPDNAFGYFPPTVDNNYFDGKLKYSYDNLLGRYASYTLNISRTIQRMIDKKGYNFDMRLYAPFSLIYPQYKAARIPYLNQIALGRVRVASGSYPDAKLNMKVVVIWSKVKN